MNNNTITQKKNNINKILKGISKEAKIISLDQDLTPTYIPNDLEIGDKILVWSPVAKEFFVRYAIVQEEQFFRYRKTKDNSKYIIQHWEDLDYASSKKEAQNQIEKINLRIKQINFILENINEEIFNKYCQYESGTISESDLYNWDSEEISELYDHVEKEMKGGE